MFFILNNDSISDLLFLPQKKENEFLLYFSTKKWAKSFAFSLISITLKPNFSKSFLVFSPTQNDFLPIILFFKALFLLASITAF